MSSDVNRVKEWVNKLINTHVVLIFSKSYCPYCKNSIEELKKFNLKNMHVEEIDKNPDVATIQNVLKDITGKSSVPRIFINKEVVGGNDDLVKEISSGVLKERLIKAQAI